MCYIAPNKSEVVCLARRHKTLVPGAESALDRFKFDVANEIGLGKSIGANQITEKNYDDVLNKMKYEAADEIGLTDKIRNGYWGDVPSRDCGAVGGKLGGEIGGNMVRKMIQFAEQKMK